VDPVLEPLLLRKSGSAGNRTRDLRISSQKLWLLDRYSIYPNANHALRTLELNRDLFPENLVTIHLSYDTALLLPYSDFDQIFQEPLYLISVGITACLGHEVVKQLQSFRRGLSLLLVDESLGIIIYIC
jgi:hypothetical protein